MPEIKIGEGVFRVPGEVAEGIGVERALSGESRPAAVYPQVRERGVLEGEREAAGYAIVDAEGDALYLSGAGDRDGEFRF